MAELTTPPLSSDTDPRRALRALVERGDGTSAAATMLRLLVLRQEHPATVVSTDVADIEENVVVIRASITLPTGAAGSGLSAEHVADERGWAAAVERTETTAIARALDTLGYPLERSTGRSTTQDPPVRREQADVASSPPAEMPIEDEPEDDLAPMEETSVPVEPTRLPERRETPSTPPVTRAPEAETPPVIDALRRANRRPSATASPATAPAPPVTSAPAPSPVAQSDDDTPLEDYSWTAFWTRAKELGLNRATIEERIGRPMHGLSPLQLRQALEQAGLAFHSSDR